MALSIVFLGSKPIGYHCLEYLIRQGKLFDLHIAAVATRQRQEFGDGYDLKALAEKNDIPLIDSLEQLPDCDIIYSVQHHQLLKARHIGKAAQIAVNLHLAPLPEYRGCNQFSFAIMDGAEEFGVTIHEMDAWIDHGAILFEKRFAVPPQCWVSELYELSIHNAIELFKESLPDLLKGTYRKTHQHMLEKERGTALHYRKEIDDLKVIDLNAPEDEISRRIRATYMPGFEPPYCIVGGKKLFFTDFK